MKQATAGWSIPRAVVCGVLALSISLVATAYEPPVVVATLLGPQPPSDVVERRTDIEMARALLARGDFEGAIDAAERLIRRDPKDPVGYNVQGVAYLGKKDFANARKSYDKALAFRPGDISTLMNLAQLEVQQKNAAGARKQYQAALAQDPKYVPAMLGLAQVEAASGAEKVSLDWLQRAKAVDLRSSPARIALANHYLARNDRAAAFAELADARRIDPDNADILDTLGRMQLKDGRKTEATETFRRLVAVRPDSAVAHYLLGIALMNEQKYTDAAVTLRKAVVLDPDYVDAISTLAGIEMRAGRQAEALRLARDLHRAAPKSGDGFSLQGDIFLSQKRPADAVKMYQSAILIQPSGALAMKLHAAQTRAGQAREADAGLQKWLNEHPDDLDTWQYSATEKLKAGQNKLAIEQFRKVLQKAPNNATALNNLAVLYQREKDPRAVATAEQAYKLMPESATVTDTLGWILVEQGQTARGLELIQKAASRDPANAEVRYHLALALVKTGDKAKAKSELEALLASRSDFPQRTEAETLLKRL